MAHDIFISHASSDKAVADAVCAALESAGIRCWIAPRDIQPGRAFAGEINRAIQNSEVMVLIFSEHSNNSEQVLREVQLAVNSHLHIIQFRIENVRLNDDLEYFLSTPHWLDALTPPLEKHLERLKTSITALLDAQTEQSVKVAVPVPSSTQKREVSVDRSQDEASTANKMLRPPMNRGRKVALAGVIGALLGVGVLGGWWFGVEQPRRETERQRLVMEQKEANRQRELVEQARLAGERKATADAEAEKKREVASRRAKEEEAKHEEDTLKAVGVASKEHPYENSLGMRFVPMPVSGVLFSVWETRVKDFEAFVNTTAYNAEGRMVSLDEKKKEWKQGEWTWKNPGFEQTGEHAVCGVSWEDARAFCTWLTGTERKAGRISPWQSYRLPTDAEWSAAVGLEKEGGTTPKARNQKVKGVYPWGSKFPPPSGAGNYAGSEVLTHGWPPSYPTDVGYRDDFLRTAPVGSFAANPLGIYDLGGNVWEWCEDWFDAQKSVRVVRGASWGNFPSESLLSSNRHSRPPEERRDIIGFRCVLQVESSR